MNDFKTLSSGIIEKFVREYGEKKHQKIYDELVNSSSFERNFPILTSGNRPPNSTELIKVVQNIRFFAFSNKMNTAIAATILIMMWSRCCNSSNEICDDSELKYILENVLDKTSNLLW